MMRNQVIFVLFSPFFAIISGCMIDINVARLYKSPTIPVNEIAIITQDNDILTPEDEHGNFWNMNDFLFYKKLTGVDDKTLYDPDKKRIRDGGYISEVYVLPGVYGFMVSCLKLTRKDSGHRDGFYAQPIFMVDAKAGRTYHVQCSSAGENRVLAGVYLEESNEDYLAKPIHNKYLADRRKRKVNIDSNYVPIEKSKN